MLMVPVPAGEVSAGLSIRIAPWLMLMAPLQPALEALSTSVPGSFLEREAVAPAVPFRSNAALSFNVAPAATSMMRVPAVPSKRMTGLPSMLAEARKAALPACGFKATVAPPSAATEPTERTPWSTTIGAPIEFEALERTKVPAPVLTNPLAAVTAPENSRPWVRLEEEAVATLKAAPDAMVRAPVYFRPYPLLFVSVRPLPRLAMLAVAMTLLEACGNGKVPPARPTVSIGTMPASKTTLPSDIVCGAAVPSPS